MARLAELHGIDMEASFAYSDSATDVPMLEAVGHPVVVNPDRVLARLARDRGWEVRHFVRPIRLRDRVPVPPPVPTAAGLGLAVAAAAAVVVWRHRHAGTPEPEGWAALRPLLLRSLRSLPSPRH
jgi:hypothetical protein